MKSKSNNQKDRWIGVKKTNKKKILDYSVIRKAKGKDDKTIYGETTTLIKLARHLIKEFRYATEEDLINFFSDDTIVKSPISSDLYATRIIQFYRWIKRLKRKERPEIMDWYEHKTTKHKSKNLDPDKKSKWLITRKEIDKIIFTSPTIQDKALWEIFYLTGARPDEILSMEIRSLKQLSNGYEIHIYRSKTFTRIIPLCEIPYHLISWLEQHPKRNTTDHSLWLSQSPQTYGEPLKRVNSIEQKFTTSLKRANNKRHLTPKCFRKTRAYMIFKADELQDSEIALFFGWKISEVPKRREDYDLTDHEDLKEKVFSKSTIPIPRIQLEKEKEILLKTQQNQIEALSYNNKALQNALFKLGSTVVLKDVPKSDDWGIPK